MSQTFILQLKFMDGSDRFWCDTFQFTQMFSMTLEAFYSMLSLIRSFTCAFITTSNFYDGKLSPFLILLCNLHFTILGIGVSTQLKWS